MKRVNQQEVEQSVKEYLKAKQAKKAAEAAMNKAEAVIARYGRENLGNFIDKCLICGEGIIQLRAGVAKPVKEGKALSATERNVLAAELPGEFVRMIPDYIALFNCPDVKVRQLLKMHGVEIVREDTFAVV